MSQEKLLVEAYSLFEFLGKLQVAILEGYELSDKNDHFPVNYGNQYVVTLVKSELSTEPEVLENDEEVTETEETTVEAPKGKPGRKPKNST